MIKILLILFYLISFGCNNTAEINTDNPWYRHGDKLVKLDFSHDEKQERCEKQEREKNEIKKRIDAAAYH